MCVCVGGGRGGWMGRGTGCDPPGESGAYQQHVQTIGSCGLNKTNCAFDTNYMYSI